MAESQENVDAAVVRGRSSIPAVSVGLQAPVLGAVLALGGSLGQQEGRGLPSVCDPRAWRDPPPPAFRERPVHAGHHARYSAR